MDQCGLAGQKHFIVYKGDFAFLFFFYIFLMHHNLELLSESQHQFSYTASTLRQVVERAIVLML